MKDKFNHTELMSETFKAGQLVPKRLGLITVPSKARHRVVFATDCRVFYHRNTKVVYADNYGPCVIHVKVPSIKRNNGTLQAKHTLVDGWTFRVNTNKIKTVFLIDPGSKKYAIFSNNILGEVL